MTQSLSNLVDKLKPFMLDAAAAAIGILADLNKIILIPTGAGTCTLFAKTNAGMVAALAAAVAGDTVIWDGTIAITSELTIPAGVTLMGWDRDRATLTFATAMATWEPITVSAGSTLANCTIGITLSDSITTMNGIYIAGGRVYDVDVNILVTAGGSITNLYGINDTSAGLYGVDYETRCSLENVDMNILLDATATGADNIEGVNITAHKADRVLTINNVNSNVRSLNLLGTGVLKGFNIGIVTATTERWIFSDCHAKVMGTITDAGSSQAFGFYSRGNCELRDCSGIVKGFFRSPPF